MLLHRDKKKNLKFVFHTLRCQLAFLKICSSLPSEQDLWVALSKVCTFTRFVTISLLPYSYYRGSDRQLIWVCTFTRFVTISLLPYSYYRGSDRQLIFVTLLYTNLEPIPLYVILIRDAVCIISPATHTGVRSSDWLFWSSHDIVRHMDPVVTCQSASPE